MPLLKFQPSYIPERPVEIHSQTHWNRIGRCMIGPRPALSPITTFTSHCDFIPARENSARVSKTFFLPYFTLKNRASLKSRKSASVFTSCSSDVTQKNAWRFCVHNYRGIQRYFQYYTGCPWRKGPNFGRVFLRSNYTDITQNTFIQSSMVTEILNIEK